MTYIYQTFPKKLTVLLFMAFSLSAAAQVPGPQRGIKGRLTDGSGNRMEFATVNLRRAGDSSLVKTLVCDSTSQFLISGLSKDSYLLSVSLVGHKPFRSRVDLTADSLVDLGILTLQETTGTLKEAQVVHKKPFIERKLDKTVLNIENNNLATGSTALELLQLAPGVTITNNDKVQLNGKNAPLIMVDGKPTYLSDQQVSNLLKSMPSNIISEIEIISQPSAKYDAAGTSGIINIRTKQNKMAGFNGSVNGGLGYGRDSKARGGINLNYKTNKLSLSLDYAYSLNNSVRTLTVNRQVPDSQKAITYFNRSGDIHSRLISNNYKASVNYSINKNHTIGAQVMGYANTQDLTNNNTTYIRDQKQTLDSLMRSNSSESSTFNNIGANVNYRGKLDSLGRELTFDADYARFRNTIHRNFSNTLYNPDNEKLGNTDFIRNYFPTSVDIYALKTDLVFPLAHKAKIEAGAKASWVTTDNDAQYDSLLENKWVPSLTQSNHFIYKENINAAYVNFRKDWGKMNIQGGLRMEQTNTDGNLLTLQSRTERHYLNFFPSAFVSRKLNDDNTFMASYSRRIERPSYQDLNPFKFYADRYTYSEGNPFLQPAYTNSFEFTHSWKDQLVTVFRYGVTHNVITEDIQQDPNTNVTKSLLINLDQLTNFSLSLSYTRDLTSWWSTDNTITLNRSEYSDNKSGNARDFHNYDFNINIYNSFRLTKSLSADLGGFYLSPWLYGFIKAQAQYKVDVGLKQNLWGKKASLKLKLSDVFATNRFRGTAVYDNNVRVYIDNRFESRIVFLTFTWLFGNSKLKVAKHNEGNSDEKSRVKTTAQ